MSLPSDSKCLYVRRCLSDVHGGHENGKEDDEKRRRCVPGKSSHRFYFGRLRIRNKCHELSLIVLRSIVRMKNLYNYRINAKTIGDVICFVLVDVEQI